PGDDATVMGTAELVERFDLERVSRNPARFDEAKLRWLDGIYMRELPLAELADCVLDFLRIADPDAARVVAADRDLLEGAVAISQEKIQTLADFWPLSGFFFMATIEDPAARERWLGERGTAMLRDAREELCSAGGFDAPAVEAALTKVIERHAA